jgi:hypothetical protein
MNKKNDLSVFREVCDKVKTIMMQHTGSIKINELISKILQNSSFMSQTHTTGNIKIN